MTWPCPSCKRCRLLQAQAGFDILGPVRMMDGRVGAMSEALDEAGYYETGIMSLYRQICQRFYGPFRDALDSAPKRAIKDHPPDGSRQ